MKVPPVVAHRGLSRIFPENTLSSVLGALDAGLAMAEIDVQLSADGVPLLHHDADLGRMSGRPGELRLMAWSEIRRRPIPEPARFGARFRAQRPTSLEDLAQALSGHPAFTLFVELKEESLRPFGRDFMLQAVAEALGPLRGRCVLISFDFGVLELARAATRFRVGPVLRSLKQIARARDLAAEWVFCDRRLLPRQGGLKEVFGAPRTCVYEVADASEARALLARGISAVETFRADTLAEELALYA